MKSVRVIAIGSLVVSAIAGAAVFGQQNSGGGGGWGGWSSDDANPFLGQLAQHANDPRFKQHQLNAKAVELAKKYAKAEKEDEKKEIRKKLAEVLSEQFDLQIKQQQKELEELEKQVDKLKTMLKKRVDAKSSIVDRHVEQLSLDAQGLGWSGPNAPHTFFGTDWPNFSVGHGYSGMTVPPPPAAPTAPPRNDVPNK